MARAEALARKQAAKDFAQRWRGRGYEKGDTAPFWLELLRDVVGMEDVTTNVRFENQTVDRGFIDVTIRDAKTVIEQKSLGVDLDKPEMRQGVLVTPFEQAKRYADSLRNSERPDIIIVSDFNEFRIHDLDTETPQRVYRAIYSR
ncbi:MAG: type IIL restriction-modification enzyme MmeI [Lawsonella sp.]